METTLDNAPAAITITEEALQFDKPGDKWRGYYMGLKPGHKIDGKTGELVPTRIARFYKDGHIYTNMGAQLCRVLENLEPGVAVEVELRELKPNKQNGKTKIYAVTALQFPALDIRALFAGIAQVIENTPPQIIEAVAQAQIEAPKPAKPGAALAEYIDLANQAQKLGIEHERPMDVARYVEDEQRECVILLRRAVEAASVSA